jgi:hypothetical protein
MILRLLKYLFYSAYWIAYDLGEKKNPQNNAEYLLSILIALNGFVLIQILKYFGFRVNTSIIILEFLLSYTIVYLMFIKNQRFKKNLNDYRYLSLIQNKLKRNVIIIIISMWTILFILFGSLINR